MIKKIFKNQIFERAFITFFEGFLVSFGCFLTSNTTFDKTMLKSAFIGAISSGLSALINYILSILRKSNKKEGDKNV